MKRCPTCAEKIQDRAVICRYCGHRFPPGHGRKSIAERLIGAGLTVLVVAFAISQCDFSGKGRDGTAPTTTSARPALSAQTLAQCAAYLDRARAAGLVLRRDDGGARTRIDVEDLLWAELPADAKRMTMQAVACDRWHADMPPAGRLISAYGRRSGRRVALLTEANLSFD